MNKHFTWPCFVNVVFIWKDAAYMGESQCKLDVNEDTKNT